MDLGMLYWCYYWEMVWHYGMSDSSYSIRIFAVVKFTSLRLTPSIRLVTRSTALLHAAEFLSMEQHPFTFAVAQLVLTVPVLVFGRNFYLHGFPALFKGNPNMDSLVAVGTTAPAL